MRRVAAPTSPTASLYPAPAPAAAAQIKDADGNVTTHNVTLDSLHVLQKGQITIFVAVKGGYVFAAKATKAKPEQSAAAVASALGACSGSGVVRRRGEVLGASCGVLHTRRLPKTWGRGVTLSHAVTITPLPPLSDMPAAIGFYWAVGPDAS